MNKNQKLSHPAVVPFFLRLKKIPVEHDRKYRMNTRVAYIATRIEMAFGGEYALVKLFNIEEPLFVDADTCTFFCFYPN